MRLLVPLVVAFALACKAGESPQLNGAPASLGQLDSSKYFSVRFPDGFSASTFNMGDESKIFPGLALEPKEGARPFKVGSLFVAHDSTYAGMLLRDGVAAQIKDLSERGFVQIVPPHGVLSANGTCIGFVGSDLESDCPKELMTDRCFIASYAAQCETPFGKRFAVMGALAVQKSANRLEPSAVEMAKTFDRIMATLEFKKF